MKYGCRLFNNILFQKEEVVEEAESDSLRSRTEILTLEKGKEKRRGASEGSFFSPKNSNVSSDRNTVEDVGELLSKLFWKIYSSFMFIELQLYFSH